MNRTSLRRAVVPTVAALTMAFGLAACGAGNESNADTGSDSSSLSGELTGGGGADVVYDPVGGVYSEPALRATAWEGRFLVIGFAAGEIPAIPLNLTLLKGCDIVGVFWGAFVGREPERHRRNVEELVAWWRAG